MKKIAFILFASALFAGCVKNDKKPATNSLLLNTWYAVKDTTTTFVNNVQSSQTNITYTPGINYVQFNGDGTGLVYVREATTPYSETFTFTQSSNSQVAFNYPAQVSNGLEQSAMTKSGIIKTLTSTDLVIQLTTTTVISGATSVTTEVQYFTTN